MSENVDKPNATKPKSLAPFNTSVNSPTPPTELNESSDPRIIAALAFHAKEKKRRRICYNRKVEKKKREEGKTIADRTNINDNSLLLVSLRRFPLLMLRFLL